MQDQFRTLLEIRNDEISNYQLNIDNFKRAIIKIDTEYSENKDMLEFKEHLQNLLAENQREQLKSIIMRDVIADQIAELEGS
jgi:flagellar motility protein MotE (MotC chaperone)